MQLLKRLDQLLNNITMYRLVLYGLSGIAVIAIGLAYTGHIGLGGTQLILSFVTLMIVCFVVNRLLGRFWPAVTNLESFLITALILGFILPPADSLSGWLALVLAGVIAMASKYLLAPYAKHMFNPAAIAAVALGVSNILPATWWVGSPSLLPFTLILGLLVVRKLHRFELFSSFVLFSLAVTAIVTLTQQAAIGEAVRQAISSSPLIFLGTIMLTEPLTTPPRRRQQIVYGALVGAIFSAQLSFGRLSSTPEIALVIGNLYAFIVSPRRNVRLQLQRITQLSTHVYDLAFSGGQKLAFTPGQYLEWTLPGVERDNRGNRRTFSIASSPTEPELHIGIKSTGSRRGFKKSLLAMQPGDTIMAGHLAGNFILPKDTAQKLVFVAGGIGITPFRSMLQHLIDTKQQRDIVLFYMVSAADEISYNEVLQQAASNGLKVIPILSIAKGASAPADWKYPTGRLTKEMLEKYVPEYNQRHFYLSGPNAMVTGYKGLLTSLGIKRRAIVSDYFSGY